MFTMLSTFAQFERSLIKERQREGIALAKAKGIYNGRKPALNAERLLSYESKPQPERTGQSWRRSLG